MNAPKSVNNESCPLEILLPTFKAPTSWWAAVRVKVVVASIMQPAVVYRGLPNTSL